MHKAWKKHQNTVYWVDINLARKKGLKFYHIRLDGTLSFFHKHFQLILFRKLLGWKLEKSYTKKFSGHLGLHQRSTWNTTGKENWVQNMLNNQKDKLGNYLEVSNRTNKFQVQVVTDRGNPLSELTREPCKMEEQRPVRRRSMKILFTKKLFLRTDRGNPLSKRVKPKHVHLMTARVSTLNWHMIDRGNPLSKQTQKMCQMVAKHVLVMKA